MKTANETKKRFTVTVEMYDGDLYQKKMIVEALNDAHAYELAYKMIYPVAEYKCIDFAIVSVK